MKIIFIRHGKYHPGTGKLSDLGIFDIKKLAKEIKEMSDELKIYTSPITRTKQTAEVLAQKLGLKYEEKDFLSLDQAEINEIKQLIETTKVDLILISHLPVIEKVLFDLTSLHFDIKMGQALMLETETKKVFQI